MPTIRRSARASSSRRLAEDILIACRRVARRNTLARVGVEASGGVPYGLVVLGGGVSLALDRYDVQQLGLGYLFQRREYAYQLLDVVAVDLSEVTEVEALEQVAVLKQSLLDGVAGLLTQAQQRRYVREEVPQTTLETVVVARGRDVCEVALEGARTFVYRHLVVVEYDKYVGRFLLSGIVQALERKSSRHGAVAYDGHDLAFLSLHLGRFGHAVCRRYRGRGVSRAEGVVFALAHAREAAYASQLAVCGEEVAAPRDYLVGVGLMPDVPDNLVVGGVVNVVYGHGELHGAEA